MKPYTEYTKDAAMLLERIRKGDPDAFAEAYDHYASSIFRYVYFRVHSRELAEDITSDVFLKTWDFLCRSPRTIRNIKHFLYTVARNLIIDSYRKRKPISLESDPFFRNTLLADTDIVESAALQEEMVAMTRALERLRGEYQEVLMLRHIEGLTIEEIAEVLKKSKNAVYILISRAHKDLKATVEGTRGTL